MCSLAATIIIHACLLSRLTKIQRYRVQTTVLRVERRRNDWRAIGKRRRNNCINELSLVFHRYVRRERTSNIPGPCPEAIWIPQQRIPTRLSFEGLKVNTRWIGDLRFAYEWIPVDPHAVASRNHPSLVLQLTIGGTADSSFPRKKGRPSFLAFRTQDMRIQTQRIFPTILCLTRASTIGESSAGCGCGSVRVARTSLRSKTGVCGK